jgi:hypothetical protein
MKTKTHFAFRIDVWDGAGDNLVEHLAGLDDYAPTRRGNTGRDLPPAPYARRRRLQFGDARMALPLWLQYSQAVAVLLLPAIGAWIAWQQVQIARVKLQHDLYDRRFAVFEAARKLLLEVVIHGDVSDASLNAYTIATADAVVLLDDKSCEYLKDVGKRSSILHTIKFTMESLPAGDQKAGLSKKAGEHLLWLNDQLDVLIELFKPFLSLERRRTRLRLFSR